MRAWLACALSLSLVLALVPSGAHASGFATGAVTDGSATALVETGLKSMLQQAWSKGGEVDTILTSPTIYNTISGLPELLLGSVTSSRSLRLRSSARLTYM